MRERRCRIRLGYVKLGHLAQLGTGAHIRPRSCLSPALPLVWPQYQANSPVVILVSASLPPHDSATSEQRVSLFQQFRQKPSIGSHARPWSNKGGRGDGYTDGALRSFMGLGVGCGSTSPLPGRLSMRGGGSQDKSQERRPQKGGCQLSAAQDCSLLAVGPSFPPKLLDPAMLCKTADPLCC